MCGCALRALTHLCSCCGSEGVFSPFYFLAPWRQRLVFARVKTHDIKGRIGAKPPSCGHFGRVFLAGVEIKLKGNWAAVMSPEKKRKKKKRRKSGTSYNCKHRQHTQESPFQGGQIILLHGLGCSSSCLLKPAEPHCHHKDLCSPRGGNGGQGRQWTSIWDSIPPKALACSGCIEQAPVKELLLKRERKTERSELVSQNSKGSFTDQRGQPRRKVRRGWLRAVCR